MLLTNSPRGGAYIKQDEAVLLEEYTRPTRQSTAVYEGPVASAMARHPSSTQTQQLSPTNSTVKDASGSHLKRESVTTHDIYKPGTQHASCATQSRAWSGPGLGKEPLPDAAGRAGSSSRLSEGAEEKTTKPAGLSADRGGRAESRSRPNPPEHHHTKSASLSDRDLSPLAPHAGLPHFCVPALSTYAEVSSMRGLEGHTQTSPLDSPRPPLPLRPAPSARDEGDFCRLLSTDVDAPPARASLNLPLVPNDSSPVQPTLPPSPLSPLPSDEARLLPSSHDDRAAAAGWQQPTGHKDGADTDVVSGLEAGCVSSTAHYAVKECSKMDSSILSAGSNFIRSQGSCPQDSYGQKDSLLQLDGRTSAAEMHRQTSEGLLDATADALCHQADATLASGNELVDRERAPSPCQMSPDAKRSPRSTAPSEDECAIVQRSCQVGQGLAAAGAISVPLHVLGADESVDGAECNKEVLKDEGPASTSLQTADALGKPGDVTSLASHASKEITSDASGSGLHRCSTSSGGTVAGAAAAAACGGDAEPDSFEFDTPSSTVGKMSTAHLCVDAPYIDTVGEKDPLLSSAPAPATAQLESREEGQSRMPVRTPGLWPGHCGPEGPGLGLLGPVPHEASLDSEAAPGPEPLTHLANEAAEQASKEGISTSPGSAGAAQLSKGSRPVLRPSTDDHLSDECMLQV